MKLTTKNGKDLSDYYDHHIQFGRNCEKNNKTHWWRLTPYDFQETLYYFCKHLALPSVGVIIFLIFLILQILNIPISDLLKNIVLLSAVLILLSVGRECIRAWKYRITKGKIKDVYNYQKDKEESLFRICTNTISQTNIRIGFVGDIMKLKNFKLLFDCEVRKFFEDVDLIVGNLEGIMDNSKKSWVTKQIHWNPPILKGLKSLKKHKTKWLLSISNNHSIDFGNRDFCRSLWRIQDTKGFDVFGSHLVPTVIIEYNDLDKSKTRNDISISTVSEWCNQKKWGCILKYEDAWIKTLNRSGKFNILYPHWSYENEKYVRSRIQKDAKTLLTGKEQDYSLFQRFIRRYFVTRITPFKSKKWDLIFGHHPHVRQPIMVITDDFTNKDGNTVYYKKLVAFSGGNFTSGAKILRKKKHIKGIIMKCDIGPLLGYPKKLVVGNVKWRRTVNKTEGNTKRVCFDNKRYITYNRDALIVGIIFLIPSLFYYFLL